MPVHGSFDAATGGRLDRAAPAPAIRIDNYNAHSRAIIRSAALGMKVPAAMGPCTRPDRADAHDLLAASGRRSRCCASKASPSGHGPFQRKGKDVPDTLVIGGAGPRDGAAALARELTRIRCRARTSSPAIRSAPASRSAPYGPSCGRTRQPGIGGTFEIGGLGGQRLRVDPRPGRAPSRSPPTAPARQAGQAIRWDLPADLRTPLRCEASYSCVPAVGAQFPLGGGFVLSRPATAARAREPRRLIPRTSGFTGPRS